jgi:hypothetical protein
MRSGVLGKMVLEATSEKLHVANGPVTGQANDILDAAIKEAEKKAIPSSSGSS